MELADLNAAILGLEDKAHPEKIRVFAWYLHVHKNQLSFKPGDIKACYDALHFPPPTSFGGYFQNLEKSKDILKNSAGYRLAAKARGELDALYGHKGHSVQITQLLRGLPGQIPNLHERTYLDEALACYGVGAFRGAVTMAWNLAYHHLCHFILTKKLADFNARWPISNPGHYKKAGIPAVTRMEDFGEEFKESQVITIARDANIISGNVFKVMDGKLGIRNSAAHPSDIKIDQLAADYFIDDLVKNVVLRLT